jgi:hypothetical protein
MLSWMKISWTPMKTVWFSSVVMVFSDGCSLVFSHIQQTILKSECWVALYCMFRLLIVFRVALACIKCLGDYPCIHCLTKKDQIHQLGTKRDASRRETKAREDTPQHQQTIHLVRRWIFNAGYSVASKTIDAFLYAASWTAIRVSSWSLLFLI